MNLFKLFLRTYIGKLCYNVFYHLGSSSCCIAPKPFKCYLYRGGGRELSNKLTCQKPHLVCFPIPIRLPNPIRLFKRSQPEAHRLHSRGRLPYVFINNKLCHVPLTTERPPEQQQHARHPHERRQSARPEADPLRPAESACQRVCRRQSDAGWPERFAARISSEIVQMSNANLVSDVVGGNPPHLPLIVMDTDEVVFSSNAAAKFLFPLPQADVEAKTHIVNEVGSVSFIRV